jgi:hypothetical protein
MTSSLLARTLAILGGLTFTLFTCPNARAGFITFTVNAPNGESALVAEQISVAACPGGACYDYEFLVANNGPLNIDGFFLGVGAVPAFPPAGDLEVATMGSPANGPFPAVAAGGAFTALLTAPFEEGATNPYSPVLFPYWGFLQFDDGAGGLPLTYYELGWYTGFPGAGALPALPPGFFTRFDLFSTLGPVAGGGGIDPFSGDVFAIIDINPGGPDYGYGSGDTAVPVCGGNTGVACAIGLPPGFGGDQPAGEFPEPASLLLAGTGLVALTAGRRLLRIGKKAKG